MLGFPTETPEEMKATIEYAAKSELTQAYFFNVVPQPGTPLYDEHEAGRFELMGPVEMLTELRTMIAHTHLSRGLFHANHASNYLPIKARLPKDKEATLKKIDEALSGGVKLKPEWLRAL